ncbi:MAG: NAD(P)/FAD-dependent oxidoreductase [Oscillospiraceae bacterium]|jgi:thioredoxin reductase (NADPH)|nr:NAD(P)/FAD-dependent oxidoreductase [Oscillospiraceae bacterium]
MEPTDFDALIVGHGPAGCSAALYLCRAGMRVAVIGKDRGALGRAELIGNYYGLPQPVRGSDLVSIGRQQCKELGARMLKDEVLALEWREDGVYEATLAESGAVSAKAALLATGKTRRAPNIEGIREFEGKGVSYCAVCDAFLYRGREVAVLGGGAYAKHEMEELLPLAKKITLLTHGAEPEFDPPGEVAVQTAKLLRLHGGELLTGAELEGGLTQPLQGLFVALGAASAGDLARKLGLPLKDGAVEVNAAQETTLPGLFAAGDCTGSFAQVAFAVAEGARAGMGMIQFLRN